MNLKERFFAQMGHYPKVKVPNFEFGYWDTTLSEWHKQGLPIEIDNSAKAQEYFGIEGMHFGGAYAPVGLRLRLLPGFESKRLRTESDGIEVWTDGDGVTFAKFMEGQNTIPHYLEYPIKGRKEWDELYKPRLNPLLPGRVPELDWKSLQREAAASDKPVFLYMDSYVGYIRNLLGFDNFATLPYDDPGLFEEMVDTLAKIKDACLDRLAGKIKFDFVQHWEDICYNAGPIISPDVFQNIVVPRMKRINDRLKNEFGVSFISLDCDGNFSALAEGWVESGVNILMPCEVDSGMDIITLQEKYWNRCGFHGGIQKKALAEGKDAIVKELERVLPAVKKGAYIPHLDHACPSNVPLENYRFYINAKRDIFNCR